MRATAIVRTKSSASSVPVSRKRRTFHPHQHVDRHAFRMRRQTGERCDHADAIFKLFAHADNAAAADIDAAPRGHARGCRAGPDRCAW